MLRFNIPSSVLFKVHGHLRGVANPQIPFEPLDDPAVHHGSLIQILVSLKSDGYTIDIFPICIHIYIYMYIIYIYIHTIYVYL